MNTKGFTLVELLAVIVILSLLTLITSTAVTKLVSDAKNDLSETQIALIKSASETWMADNLTHLPDAGQCSYLTLEDLKNYGLLDSNVLDPKDNQKITDDLKIKISTTLSKYGNPVRSVEVNPESIDGCKKIYELTCKAVTIENATKFFVYDSYNCDASKIGTTSNIPEGNYEAGDEYICEVAPGVKHRFFVLTQPSQSSTTVNLIMYANINEYGEPVDGTQSKGLGLTYWTTKEDLVSSGGVNTDYPTNYTSYGGPITAMNYLAKATSSWANVKNIIMDYTDEGDFYGTVKSNNDISTITTKTGTITATYKNLKARLPYNSEISSFQYDGKKTYLYDYLKISGGQTSCYIFERNEVPITGYFTMAASSPGDGYTVESSGILGPYSTYVGVRPVITVPKSVLN